jgi:putative aldouronate transport system permease protein
MRILSRGERWFDVVNYAALAALAFVCLYPVIMMAAISLNRGTDTMSGGVFFWPRSFTLVNYQVMLQNAQLRSAYVVTILRTVIGTLGSVFITAIVAYGLSEHRLPGRKYIMVYMLIPMFFSGGLIPYYLQLRSLHLINSFWVFVIPGLFSIWNCIVMKTFFQGIPESLKESMRIDGAGELTVLFRIVFPLSTALFAAISLFNAVGHWNDWFSGAFFVTKGELVPVQTFLMHLMNMDMSQTYNLEAQQAAAQAATRMTADYATITSLSLRMAAVMVGLIPILLVYPFLQRYFVKGVLIGSVKE